MDGLANSRIKLAVEKGENQPNSPLRIVQSAGPIPWQPRVKDNG